MSRRAYIFRAWLYIAIAVLPIVRNGIASHTLDILVVIDCAIAAAVTVRAFIDKSPSEHDATKAADAAATAATAAATPVTPAAPEASNGNPGR